PSPSTGYRLLKDTILSVVKLALTVAKNVFPFWKSPLRKRIRPLCWNTGSRLGFPIVILVRIVLTSKVSICDTPVSESRAEYLKDIFDCLENLYSNRAIGMILKFFRSITADSDEL